MHSASSMTSLMILALVGLAACAPQAGGNLKAAPVSGLQLDMKTQAMQATPLTAAQKSEIQAISKAQTELTPDTSLYFDQAKDADDNKKSLARLNSTGRTYIDLVKKNCTIDPGQDQKSGDAVAGQTQTVLSAQTISGDKCPIAYNTSSKSVTNYSAISATGDNVSAAFHFDGTNSLKVSDEKMAKDDYIVDSEITTSGDITYTNYSPGTTEDAASKGSLYAKFSAKGTMTTVDQKTLAISGTIEKSSTPGIQAKQAIYSVNLPSGATVVIWEQQINGEMKIIVNGEKYTPERLKAELGWFGNSL